MSSSDTSNPHRGGSEIRHSLVLYNLKTPIYSQQIMEESKLPTQTETNVKILDGNIEMIFTLLKKMPLEQALCILENVQIRLEASEVNEEEIPAGVATAAGTQAV
ncbi:MAG TPA: hypothetical protein VKK79_20395 [Candidatus Lokiarchaeia archaeon]|nr:hypothetical protein [Candidatus Lokiarchaeia archaeon]